MKKELFLIPILFLVVSLIFFYPIFKGLIPFPGDLLVGNYEPYRSYSYQGYTPQGVPHKAQGSDVIRELFPWKFFSIEELKNKQIPFWNPYNFAGNPLFANLQSGTFYLANILFFVFPFIFAWGVYIIIQPILAGFFTYLFLREIKLSKISSFYGGLIFAFSAFMTVWLEYGNFGHTILWLPLVLWLINRFINKPNLIKLIILIAILVQSILAGYIQLAIYLYIFSLSFILFRFLQERNKKQVFKTYTGLFIAFGIPILLTAFQLVPLMEFVQNSSRVPYSFNQLSERLIPVKNIITIIFPDFFGNPATRNYWLPGTYIERASYIGILSILFILFAVFSKEKSKYKKFFLFAALISYLSTLDIYPVKLIHAIGIPALSTGVPSRILVLFCFSASVLAAIGIDLFIKSKEKKEYIKPLIIIVVIIAVTWSLVFLGKNENFFVTKRNLIIPTFIFILGMIILFKSPLSQRKKGLIIIILTAIDLFYSFHKITPFSPIQYVYPKTAVIEELKKLQNTNERYWGYGSAHIDGNFQLYEKSFFPEGYDALYIKRYGEFLSTSKDGKIVKDIPATIAEIAPGYGESDLRNNQYRQKLLNLLGVKYVLHKPISMNSVPDFKTFPEKIYKLIWQKGDWQIYENKDSFPRVFLSSKYVVKQKKEDIISTMFDKNISLRDTVILEENLSKKIDLFKDPNAKAEFELYTPNKIVIKTQSSSNNILFLSDNYYPGWHATVDTNDTKIYRADYSFRGVPVEKGNHTIVFWYYPESFDLGLKISLITLIFLVLCIIILSRKGVYEFK